MTRKWYVTLSHPKMHSHTKLLISTSSYIRICSGHDHFRNLARGQLLKLQVKKSFSRKGVLCAIRVTVGWWCNEWHFHQYSSAVSKDIGLKTRNRKRNQNSRKSTPTSYFTSGSSFESSILFPLTFSITTGVLDSPFENKTVHRQDSSPTELTFLTGLLRWVENIIDKYED